MRKGMTLEQEFERTKLIHKWSIILATIIFFEDEGIYDCYLLKNKFDDIELEGEEKAKAISTELLRRAENGHGQEFDELYNYCWDKLSEELSDEILRCDEESLEG